MIGETLGHYRILERIGAGGMGEVFVAHDDRLGRDVALKILPADVAETPDRLARFRREARAAAALNHPGIVTVLSVEEERGVHFLTMELVEGSPLGELIPRGGLPLDEFYSIAVQLADALAAAHRGRVVHRDLKPGNVMLADDGRLKILDFGLARRDSTGSDEETTSGVTEDLTQEGQVFGTAAYMSPEQVKGYRADARSDIFSLGACLYEIATGRRAFQGSSGAAVMSAILTAEPAPPTSLRPELPRALERILLHCLEKEPDRRFQTALDVRNELVQVRDEVDTETPRGAQARRRGSPAALWAVAVLAAVGLGAVLWSRHGGSEDGAVRSTPPAAPLLRQITVSDAVEGHPTYSADGRALAYTKEVDGYSKIFLRDLETGSERQLTDGGVDDIQPALAPEGGAVVFVRSARDDGELTPSDPYFVYGDGDIWRLDLASGEELRIAESAYAPAFSPDGSRIAFEADWAGPHRVWTADPYGRNPRQVTSDSSELVSHLRPRWSPDGGKLVFQHNRYTTRYDLRTVDLASGEMAVVTDDAYLDTEPAWSADGRWIYFSSYRSGGMNLWRVAVDGSGAATAAPQQLTTGAGADVQAAVAPDGSGVAFAVQQRDADLWRLPVAPRTGRPRGDPEPLVATTRQDSRGAWSPDGTRIAFNSDRSGTMNLWVLSLSDGATRRLTEGEGGDYQPAWSPDGGRIAFFSSRAGNADVWEVDVATGELRQLTRDPGIDISPAYSPDGSRIAFQSDRDGRREAWVMAADGTDPRQLTRRTFGGLHYFLWTADSRWVLFRGAEGGAWRLPVDGDGEPELVAENVRGWHMSFSPDRRRIADNDHHTLQVTDLVSDQAEEVFAFEDPSIEIDYSVWSPDGEWILFDRTVPRGGDIWKLEIAG